MSPNSSERINNTQGVCFSLAIFHLKKVSGRQLRKNYEKFKYYTMPKYIIFPPKKIKINK